MKKCPYCAEEIQEEAIKCKHCGEWLAVPKDDTGTDRSDTSRGGREEKDKIDSVEQNLEPTTQRNKDNTQYDEIPGVKPLAKKPGKYGWGWLLFLGILAIYGSRNDPFTDHTLSTIWCILTFLFLIPYFALRRRFLKKWEFPGSKPWKAGLAAGFCTYLLVTFVLGIMLFLDARSLKTTWKEFSSGEGTFSILMPGTPTKKILKVNTQEGTIDMHLFILEQKGVAYTASYGDYPEAIVQAGNVDKMLDGARDGAVSNVQGKLLSELIISLDKYPGRKIRIETPDGKYTFQPCIYLVKNRFYQVGIVTPKEGSFSKDVTKFFDSFRLLEK